MNDVLECYKALDVPPGCPPHLIRKAYVALCQVWDPARFEDNPPLRERAQAKRAELDDAYRFLKEFLPELRGPEAELPQEDWVITPKPIDHIKIVASSRRLWLGVLAAVISLVFVTGYLVYQKQRAAQHSPPAANVTTDEMN